MLASATTGLAKSVSVIAASEGPPRPPGSSTWKGGSSARAEDFRRVGDLPCRTTRSAGCLLPPLPASAHAATASTQAGEPLLVRHEEPPMCLPVEAAWASARGEVEASGASHRVRRGDAGGPSGPRLPLAEATGRNPDIVVAASSGGPDLPLDDSDGPVSGPESKSIRNGSSLTEPRLSLACPKPLAGAANLGRGSAREDPKAPAPGRRGRWERWTSCGQR